MKISQNYSKKLFLPKTKTNKNYFMSKKKIKHIIIIIIIIIIYKLEDKYHTKPMFNKQ